MDAAGIPDFAELSRLTNVSQTQFSHWRSGRSQPSHGNLNKIAPVLRVRPVRLYLKAGLNERADFELGDLPEIEPLPKPVSDIREAYERLRKLGRGEFATRSIEAVVAILEAEIAEIEGFDRRSRNQPSGRRRSG